MSEIQGARCAMTCGGGKHLMQRGAPVVGNTTVSPEWNEVARRCARCGYVFFPPPPNEELSAFYGGRYAAHNAPWYNVETDYSPAKVALRADRVLSVADRFGYTLPVCHEIGCSFGGTVGELVKRGCVATGTDIGADAIRAGQALGNPNIYAESDLSFLAKRDRPDMLYSFHAIEHMPDPIKALSDLRPHVGGIAAIWVPNALFPAALVKGFSVSGWFTFPEHLHMFSPSSLLCLASAAGYDLIHVETRDGYGLAHAAMQSMLPDQGDTVGAAVRSHLLNWSLMGEELEFALTPKGSELSERFGGAIAYQAERLRRMRDAELRLMDLL